MMWPRASSAFGPSGTAFESGAVMLLLLGYSEQSTFQHAFKRWVGVTPGEFRTRHLAR